VNLTAMPDEHWYFVNWTGDYEGTEEGITITMDADYTITAEFVEVAYVEITPSEDFILTAGDTTNFSATAYDSENDLITDDDTDFEWNNTDEYGLFDETEAGNYEVYATYLGVYSDIVIVTVEPADVEYVFIDPEEDQVIEAGEEVVFSAEAYDEFHNFITDDLRDFEWDNASRGVFYQTRVGDYEVTASYDGVASESTSVTVEPAEAVEFWMEPGERTRTAGESQEYNTWAEDDYGNQFEVTEDTYWSIDEDAGGEWDQNTGVYTSEFAGEWTVEAEYDGFEDTATLIIEPAEAVEFWIEPAEAEIIPGESQEYNAWAEDDYGNQFEVTDQTEWSDDVDPEDASSWDENVITVEEEGLWTVTGEYESLTAETTLDVEIGDVDYVEIEPKEEVTVSAGEELEFDAWAYDEQGNLITDYFAEFVWENTTSMGVFIEGDTGKYEVTASYDGVTSEPTTVTVEPAEAVEFWIEPGERTRTAGESQEYNAWAEDDYGNQFRVTEDTYWSIDEDAGGEWDQNTGVYTSEFAGEWTVEAEYDGFEDTATLIIEPAEANYIEISPEESMITAGESENYTAILYDEFGNEIGDVTHETEWSDDVDPDDASSWDENKITVNKTGTWEIIGEYEGIEDTAMLTIETGELDKVVIDPEEDQIIESGDEVVFTAEAQDEYGNLITDDLRLFEWENASRGVFYLEAVGEYDVTATYEGVTSEPTTVRVVEELYYLTINIDGEGDVDVDPDQEGYEENTNVTLTAISEDGWEFVEWTGDYEGTETEITITMDDDKEITAVFEEVPVEEYDLIINVEGEGTTDPSEGTHTYDEGTVVTVEATPAEGWEFIMWTGDVTGTEITIEITMDDDKEIWAVFEEEEPLEPYFEVEITAPEDGAEYEKGDTLTVEFTITNTGDIVGTQDIIFSVDGTEVDRMENVDIVSGGTISGEFEWEADDEGDYQLEVASEDDEDSVEISVVEDDDEWWEIPGFTTILLILGAFLAVAIYYKKEQ